jgi:hypothetical protein
MVAAAVGLSLAAGCAAKPAYRTFASPEDAVRALNDAVKAGRLEEVVAIFGSEGKELVDSSDAATARRNREIFVAAVAERWRLEEQGANRVLVIGNEDWPFPVPLVKDGTGWRFDTASGKEEVLARRIGRNELAVIRICRAYVNAQHLYAARAHDGKPAGLFAQSFRSDPGRQNGLYWPAGHGEKPSPLGDLVAQAAQEGAPIGQGGSEPAPFHGYFFKIVTGQGAAAPGGARDYLVNGQMSGGFALVAWPAQYDVTGVMTFVVNQDGDVREKDLGPETAGAARGLQQYNPDDTWSAAAGASRQ